MSWTEKNVFFVSTLGINDVAKPGQGVHAPGKDDLHPERSPIRERRVAMRKHWSNPGESSMLSAYEEDAAYEIACRYLRQGKEVTLVVISLLLAARNEVPFLSAGGYAVDRLHIKYPDHLERYSQDCAITEIRQLRRIPPKYESV
ncbi:hypothetical protein CRV24_002955 [Beauveria bassiana]|nr:hypothetical protein CRV24_002955 [Beauveria bassiana]